VGKTAIDAVKGGMKVTVIEETTKAVNEGTGKDMIEKLKSCGIEVVSFENFMNNIK
jgi:nicotinamidase-related amidase